ncbi:uncharacterized protein Dana_GF11662 [Drosophila ananassae]|uniref:Uncharacterized protein n=1 Tax=Drosophila ananassae TaxID=7217 RepID=B3MIE6_DROAN|nr:uncharacterized protein Dana_GF11662 [Drosophila ananassae]
MSGTIVSTLLLILLINWTTSAPADPGYILVPRIDHDGFLLEPQNNQYYLRIDNYEGGFREETGEQIAPGILLVHGRTTEQFPDRKTLKVTYEAGPNGYQAKYTYGETELVIQHLPPVVLKTASG